MRIQLKTKVSGHYKDIMARFDRTLFEALKPVGGEMEIVEFTGSKKGAKVHLRFVKPIKAEWISKVIEDGISDSEAWFVDEGIKLPFPLSSWKHRHIVRRINENESLIIDDMTFEGKNFFWSCLLYPGVFLGFYPRRWQYRNYFNQK